MGIREKVMSILQDILAEKKVLLREPIADDAILLNTGLDSLGFAVLVIRLESELGFDPFVEMKDPIYPRTLAEFISVYESHEPKQSE